MLTMWCQVDSPVSLENTESKASRLTYMTKKTDDDYISGFTKSINFVQESR